MYRRTVNMKSIYKVINNVPSHLITWSNPFDCNGRDVIVCIAGNPGISDYYIEFGFELHKQTSLPVCIIGHAGHDEVPDHDHIKLQNNEQLFNLKGQIEHKLDVIKNHIDRDSKVHLIGHSIGAWMILELMDKERYLQDKIISTNLLFPTLQKMADTPNGFFLNKVVRRLHVVVLFFSYLISLLPNILFKFLLNCYLKFYAYPSCYYTRIKKFFNPNIVEKALFLGYEEMDTILTLNSEGVKKLCLHTNIIYGVKDSWVPVHYIEDLKSLKPSIETKQVDIIHAFVLKSSERVASMISQYIKPKISKH